MRIIKLLPFFRRQALLKAHAPQQTLCRLALLCPADAADGLQAGLARALEAAGMRPLRAGHRPQGEGRLACLTLVLLCPADGRDAFGGLLRQFAAMPEVYRLRWERKPLAAEPARRAA
ncbi:hypothetical protein CEK28_13110 [Xenophilus sp. AP218F]|nr:hypothetical protein [Chromobacterium sp. ASV5]OWY38209.1 hypothetical protein CEK28_13110 [Xenophilus sp. AP218F]